MQATSCPAQREKDLGVGTEEVPRRLPAPRSKPVYFKIKLEHIFSHFLSVLPWALEGKMSKHPPYFLALITIETSVELMGRRQELERHKRGMRVRFFPVHLFILIDV